MDTRERRARRGSSWAAAVAGLILAVVVTACMPGATTGGSAAPTATSSAPSTPSAREIDVSTPLTVTDGRVESTCFSFPLPGPEWALEDASGGCAAIVAVDGLALTAVRVRAVKAPDDLEGLSEVLEVANRDGDPRVDIVTFGGRTVVRVISTAAEGLEVASWGIPFPDSGFSVDGEVLGAIVVTAMYSPEFEAIVEPVIVGLTRADGAPV